MTYARDTALADRQSIDCFIHVWNQLGEAIAQHGCDLDAVRAAHRSDCLARYGEDIFGDWK